MYSCDDKKRTRVILSVGRVVKRENSRGGFNDTSYERTGVYVHDERSVLGHGFVDRFALKHEANDLITT